MIFNNWVVGLIVSLVLGGVITELFVQLMRKLLSVQKSSPNTKRFPSWLTGAMERLFFTVLLGLNAAGIAPAMMAWLALKMATNWNRSDEKEKPETRTLGFIALVAGLISMGFAYIGGSFANGTIGIFCP